VGVWKGGGGGGGGGGGVACGGGGGGGGSALRTRGLILRGVRNGCGRRQKTIFVRNLDGGISTEKIWIAPLSLASKKTTLLRAAKEMGFGGAVGDREKTVSKTYCILIK